MLLLTVMLKKILVEQAWEQDFPSLGPSLAQEQCSSVALKSRPVSGSLVIFLVPSLPQHGG